MKVGDLVMFTGTGIYGKWFYGKMGEIKKTTISKNNGKLYCRVQWLHPVKYHDRFTSVSSFSSDNFKTT